MIFQDELELHSTPTLARVALNLPATMQIEPLLTEDKRAQQRIKQTISGQWCSFLTVQRPQEACAWAQVARQGKRLQAVLYFSQVHDTVQALSV